jgi:ATP-dependent Lhr-like helicase
VWILLHTFEEAENLFAAELRKPMAAKASVVAGQYPQRAIPFHRASDGIHYYTFAGRIVNKAVALKLGKAGAIAKDMVLISQSPVDWASLPSDPGEYGDIFLELFESDGDQSYYQKLLPGDLQIREFLQRWLKDSATREILDRLANSCPIPVVPALLADFE